MNRIHTHTHTHRPEEHLNVDDCRGNLLHHIGNEVEPVARTVGMNRTYTGKKNPLHQYTHIDTTTTITLGSVRQLNSNYQIAED